MGRADDLRALADEVERYDELHTAYVASQRAVRTNPGDAEVAAEYRAAKCALAEHRTMVRQAENRSGLAFGADMIRSEG